MNPEKEFISWLAEQFPDADSVAVSTPPGITGQVIRAYRTSGANVRQLDAPIFDVDCFDVDASEASDFAISVRDAITNDLPHTTHGGAAFTRVDVIDGPRRLPWDNTNTTRYGASYQIYMAPAPTD